MTIYKCNIWVFLIVLGGFFIQSCVQFSSDKEGNSGPAVIYPETENIQAADYARLLYVSKSGSDTSGNGSKEQPYHSVLFTLEQIKDVSSDNRIAVCIAKGVYNAGTIAMKEYVDLYGGFDENNWQRDIEKFATTLSGGHERRVLIAANHSKLDGFIITEGIIKDKGAAMFCDGTSPLISNNIFVNNKTLAPDNWNPEYWHETANDGGAIYGRNGASPVITRNLFTGNKTENGRGAALSFDGQCQPAIRDNVFLNNIAGLKDPMRSSDGGAINIFNRSDAIIEGNLFISNRAESKNDGGGVFIALWSSAKVSANLFVDNHSGDDAGALFVGGQEHRYDAALDPIPPKDKFFVSIKNNTFIGNHHGGTNSGAMRFTMESRGEFIANKLAHNNGVYFQRSEVRVADNMILDNFLFIETKQGLQKGVIENNLLWADYDQQVEAEVRNNNMLHVADGQGNYHKAPKFINDGFEITSLSTNYKRRNYSTLVFLGNSKFAENQLVNRVVKSADRWGVIKSNSANTITIWGNFIGEVSFTVLPTYTMIE
jgi:Right handed beta helix region